MEVLSLWFFDRRLLLYLYGMAKIFIESVNKTLHILDGVASIMVNSCFFKRSFDFLHETPRNFANFFETLSQWPSTECFPKFTFLDQIGSIKIKSWRFWLGNPRNALAITRFDWLCFADLGWLSVPKLHLFAYFFRFGFNALGCLGTPVAMNALLLNSRCRWGSFGLLLLDSRGGKGSKIFKHYKIY